MRFALGRRIDVEVRPAFWWLAGLLAFGAAGALSRFRPEPALIWVAVVFLSVLAHELGHAGAALSLGAARARIALTGFGGETRHDKAGALSTARECAITACGPLAGFAAAGLSFALLPRLPEKSPVFYFFMVAFNANLIWSALNLVPVPPLDGGRLSTLVLGARWGAGGLKAAQGVGAVVAGVLTLAAVLAGSYFTAFVFGMLGVGCAQTLRALWRRTPEDDDPELRREFSAIQELLKANALDEASRRLIALRRRARAGVLHETATEQLGRVFAATGQRGAAYALLKGLRGRLDYQGRGLLMLLAQDSGEHEEALSLGRSLFSERREPAVALAVASSAAALGEDKDALDWLGAAARGGLRGAGAALDVPAFDRLRGRPEFERLRGELG
ncbi:MAG: hypothetical protein KGM24_01440 [Elusimicrobia bacterium]|nr:hypothetical protein [Elusimicrobiota bacterium]